MASKPEDPPLTNPWITSDGSPLRGFYWTRIDPKVQPNYWVKQGDFYVGLRVSCKCTSKPKEARMLTFAVFVLRLLLIQCCLDLQ
ncbi:hypothetical protein N7519_010734 [Penicillium mononematosum]|uniref:uncharacterized protein n=1 Tax=Penicillium mononematosum TaxID=268346 RepID=UPI00254661C2|nr:uncharacterized protein N7519_010734 [Penicillium mononematosum]KAJ6180273.1 hypothetical protein N7519_010734 [Penicillium mononematosum]